MPIMLYDHKNTFQYMNYKYYMNEKSNMLKCQEKGKCTIYLYRPHYFKQSNN